MAWSCLFPFFPTRADCHWQKLFRDWSAWWLINSPPYGKPTHIRAPFLPERRLLSRSIDTGEHRTTVLLREKVSREKSTRAKTGGGEKIYLGKISTVGKCAWFLKQLQNSSCVLSNHISTISNLTSIRNTFVQVTRYQLHQAVELSEYNDKWRVMKFHGFFNSTTKALGTAIHLPLCQIPSKGFGTRQVRINQ